ncbi:MAG: SOS response-associated peptidase [Porphyromonadaceae bacterium]|nr:MAG: SOS response-associated peptidase [Porphyromonadaceae bacterium]
MCVFLSLRADKANLTKRFDSTFVEEESFGPKYVQNAFEFPKWPVISSERSQEIRLMNWGLIPSWIKDQESALKFRVNTVNARAETIFAKPAFRRAAANKHCLVLADGFFEFRELNGKKYPYYIRVHNGRLFAMAGLYEYWAHPETGEMIPGFSVITTIANPLMEMIHNRKKRMPVILFENQERNWLNPGTQFSGLLRPYPEEDMEAWPVSRKISERGGGKNIAEVLDPYDYLELSDQKPSQGSLF